MQSFYRSTLYQRGAFVNEQRLAVDFDRLGLTPEMSSALLEHLTAEGLATVIAVDLIAEMRKYKNNGTFHKRATSKDASEGVFNCASFVRYGYGLLGLRLPPFIVDQLQLGTPVHHTDLRPGDLVFRQDTAAKEQVAFLVDPNDDEMSETVVHVGMVTSVGEKKKVIHCAGRGVIRGVIEVDLDSFLNGPVAIRRYVPDLSKIVTLQLPIGSEIEEDIDLKAYVIWDHWAREFELLNDPDPARRTLNPIKAEFSTIE